MILVDTSVWVEHFRHGNIGLDTLLQEGQVVCHPFIVGELACGNIKNRSRILSLLSTLPIAHTAEHEEVMHVIEKYQLMGKGLGYIDVHLLASAMLTHIPLWTLDKRLNSVSTTVGAKW
ncbi:MAG: type II toxin-antitoxin system VapC family toxin [Nitrospirae bacterium]|nr:type II toxin-antitoxin system VapC family toxin [Nitrospirota bacterium]